MENLGFQGKYVATNTSANSPSQLQAFSDKIEAARHVLRKWRAGLYDDDQETDGTYITYLLNHKYTTTNLRLGARALKGRDVHLVANLSDIAAEQGFHISLSSMTFRISGYSDDTRGGWGAHVGDHHVRMTSEAERDMQLDGLFDLNGRQIVDHSFELSTYSLVPQDAFDKNAPDKEEFEGRYGEVSHSDMMLSCVLCNHSSFFPREVEVSNIVSGRVGLH